MGEVKINHVEAEKFEDFLMEMDDVLDDFADHAQASGFELDTTVQSLDRLERYFLSMEPRFLDQTEIERFINRAGRYLGEVLRINYGGRWELCIDDPNHIYYGQPMITGYAKQNLEFAPIAAFRRFSRRKQPGMLRQIIDNHINPTLPDVKPEP